MKTRSDDAESLSALGWGFVIFAAACAVMIGIIYLALQPSNRRWEEQKAAMARKEARALEVYERKNGFTNFDIHPREGADENDGFATYVRGKKTCMTPYRSLDPNHGSEPLTDYRYIVLLLDQEECSR